MIEVLTALAVICFNSQCYSVLIGKDTPPGIYQLEQYRAPSVYGGDVLVFKETETEVFAIHRTVNPKVRSSLYKQDATRRKNVSGGCINVEPSVYSALISCCKNKLLVIR